MIARAAAAVILCASALCGCRGGSHSVKCGRDSECMTDQLCVADARAEGVDLAPLPLICGEPLVGSPAGAFCDTGDACDHGFCLIGGTCATPCEQDADCNADERCASGYAPTGPHSMQLVHACVTVVTVPPDVTVSRRVVPSAVAGPNNPQPVDFGQGLSPSQRLLAVLDTREGLGAEVDSLSTLDPSPETLYDPTANPIIKLNPASPEGDPITVLIPNGPGSVVTSAGYRALVSSFVRPASPAEVDLTQMTRSSTGTAIDLDLFYVGVPHPSAPTDPPPAYVATAIQRIDAIWASAGIHVGDVRQHVLVGQLAQQFSIIDMNPQSLLDPWPDLPRLFELSAGVGRPSVPIFLVRDVAQTLGISGDIPGPQGVHGTAGSGIAISLGPINAGGSTSDGIDLGRVMAHELGHFLGLFHTTEQDGSSIEPLDDTPECPASHDTNGDGVVSPSECSGFGADNLMFWAPVGENVTPEQDQVVDRAFVLR